jgi:hypothetical protein
MMADQTQRTRRRIDYLRHHEEPAAETPQAASFSELDPRFPGWRREGEFLYRRRSWVSGGAVDVWAPPFSPEAVDPGQIVFYDTETTGLSGGSGNVIFLFGAARCDGLDLVVEQLFLSDFPGEPEFLTAVRDLLRPFPAWVSYNGKAFDSHLLTSRFLMNGMQLDRGAQVDLLHHARRLWRTITRDCSLTSIEREILGVSREVDVAGEDIPLVWLQFLRTGSPGILPVVFEHNLTDITSLARMYRIIGDVSRGADVSTPVDAPALGRWLLRRSEEDGAAVLEEAFRRGSLDAGILLSLHFKRRREWDRAVEIWESILSASRSMFAAVELAKHLEHRLRDPGGALRMVELVASWEMPLTGTRREELARRARRLKRKVSGEP